MIYSYFVAFSYFDYYHSRSETFVPKVEFNDIVELDFQLLTDNDLYKMKQILTKQFHIREELVLKNVSFLHSREK